MFRFQLFVFAYLFLSFAISSHSCEAGKGQWGRVEGHRWGHRCLAICWPKWQLFSPSSSLALLGNALQTWRQIKQNSMRHLQHVIEWQLQVAVPVAGCSGSCYCCQGKPSIYEFVKTVSTLCGSSSSCWPRVLQQQQQIQKGVVVSGKWGVRVVAALGEDNCQTGWLISHFRASSNLPADISQCSRNVDACGLRIRRIVFTRIDNTLVNSFSMKADTPSGPTPPLSAYVSVSFSGAQSNFNQIWMPYVLESVPQCDTIEVRDSFM